VVLRSGDVIMPKSILLIPVLIMIIIGALGFGDRNSKLADQICWITACVLTGVPFYLSYHWD